MIESKKILIVGAGLSGCTIARVLAEFGYECTILEQRCHLAGNAYDYENQLGIRQHKYGPHLFHTSNEKVVDFLSRFTKWTDYKHRVKAQLESGQLVTLPINRATKEIVGEENCVETFIRPYSEKMWGMPLEEIDPKIINRVPMRDDMNEFYFPNDTFQAIPTEGYTKMVEKMVTHPNISLQLKTPFEHHLIESHDHVFYSGPIDEFMDFEFGPLPYRSLKFHNVNVPIQQAFPVAQVNFTHKEKFTRVVEWKNIPDHGDNDMYTTLTFEEPCNYRENNDERFYPVKDVSGTFKKSYEKYRAAAGTRYPNITFCGRLGLYAYLDMHQAVSSSLKIAENWLEAERSHEYSST